MSGSNPFRHRKPAAETADGGPPRGGSGGTAQPPTLPPRAGGLGGGGYFGVEDLQQQQQRRPSPRKTVRIASPPTERIPISPMTEDEAESPVFNFNAVAHSNHRGSPPPLSRGDDTTTSSSVDDDEDEDGDAEGRDPFNNPNNPDSSGSENEEVIRDTFRQQQRNSWSTSVDPEGVGVKKSEEPLQGKFAKPMSFAGESEASLGKDSGGEAGRAALDVDSFKRLLLTGDAGDRGSATFGHKDDGLYAAATKYPDLDPTLLPPGGARDISATPLNNSVANSGHKERKKPPPPKTRHGKPIKVDELQTAPSPQPTPERSSSSLSASYTPPRQSSGSYSDTNKSQPVPPTEGASIPPTDSRTTQSPPEVLSSVPPQFKKPPTPPLARRQSQLRSSKNSLTRSNSGRIAQPSTSGSNAAPSHKVPPPPPRRQDRTALTSSSESSSQHGVPSSGVDHGTEESTTQQTPSRTPSISSGKQHHRLQNIQPPRPPPPRRLRASSRSSADSANPVIPPAGEIPKSTGQEGGGATTDTSNANDILADLSKLQREVDELRGQYQSRTQH
ncbi:hypothetical protein FQN54_004351 [Arachnomyces sp. PD_36]|nr:hypothetical protein FQN54_004351 [Arachnomyces sp. PD_36]